MGDRVERVATPALDGLEAQFRAASPVFRDAVARTRTLLGEGWAADADDTLARLLPDPQYIARAVAGYSRFALDALRLQARFEQTREYRHRTFAEVEAAIYADDEYMTACYLPGLLLSHFLWPHHYRQLRFFDHAFVDWARRAGPGTFYDVGVGTGIYSRRLLAGAPDLTGTAFDISASSARFAERHADAYGFGDRFAVRLQDVLEDPPAPVDHMVCVEVLEHLEDPVGFLRGLRAMLRPGGRAFLATALNAANADHIYLYRTSAEVIDHLDAAGFEIHQYASAWAAVPRRPGVPVPEVMAFIVS